MPKFSDRLKTLRFEAKLSQQELADKIGFTKSSINMYERGDREPGLEKLEVFADYFNVDMDYLLGKSDFRNKNAWLESVNIPNNLYSIKNIIPLPETKKIPLLGSIACGEPILAEENIVDLIEIPKNINATFALTCHGDSMTGARIMDGDIVYIHEQPDVENGQIAAVLIGDEATLKKVYKYPNMLVLRPENPAYEEMVFQDNDLDKVKIIGLAVSFHSAVRHHK